MNEEDLRILTLYSNHSIILYEMVYEYKYSEYPLFDLVLNFYNEVRDKYYGKPIVILDDTFYIAAVYGSLNGIFFDLKSDLKSKHFDDSLYISEIPKCQI